MVTDGSVETPVLRAAVMRKQRRPHPGGELAPPGEELAPLGPTSLQRGLNPDQVAYLGGRGIFQQADGNWVRAVPDGGNDVGYLSGSRGKTLVLTPKRLKYPLVWL